MDVEVVERASAVSAAKPATRATIKIGALGKALLDFILELFMIETSDRGYCYNTRVPTGSI